MAQGKQAKVITPHQERVVLEHLRSTRNPERDRVMFLLSLKAGLRAKEMAALTWGMVTNDHGGIGECIELPDDASKGRSGRPSGDEAVTGGKVALSVYKTMTSGW